MSYLFTVRWPLFARLEAALLFPVACSVIGSLGPVRTFIEQRIVFTLAPLGIPLGIPNQAIFWAGVAVATILPYVVLLVVTDRFLTVRKGFALLSIVAIAIWSVVAWRSPALVGRYLPEPLLRRLVGLSYAQKAVVTLGGLAFLLHLKALWTGLRDDGAVAENLIADTEAYPYRRRDQPSAEDVYSRQTAEFRGWRIQKQFDGLGAGQKEHPAVRFLFGVAWVCAIVGMGAAWLTWNGFPGFGSGLRYHEAEPMVEAGPVKTGSGVKAVAPTAPQQAVRAVPLMPPPAEHVAPQPTEHVASLPAEHTAPPASERVAAAAPPPMPTVQRPTSLSSSVRAGGNVGGVNEAVAQRGNDGSFAFDAVVNGVHVRMLFDTGASVVGLRAEDAERLGISLSGLTYSAKVKTANGSAEVAPVLIDSMIIGNITLRNVAGFVAKQGMLQQNLLGQTFLARLSGFNVENNLLVLRGR